jgi:hypothetical protein
LQLTCTVLVKIAILLFYLKVFPNQTFKTICKVMIGLCIAFWISFFFALTFQCTPVSYAWLRWDGEHEGTCINVYVGGFAHAALNMVFDIAILIMPLPLIYRLQRHYSWRQKSHIFVMFSFGLIVTIVCILRLNTLITFGNSLNPTYDYTAAAIWSVVEAHVAIICACLPAAKKFLVKFVPSWIGVTTKDSKHSRTASGGMPKDNWTAASSKRDSNRKSAGIVSVRPHTDSEGFTELVSIEEQRDVEEDASRAAMSPRSMSPLAALPGYSRHTTPTPFDDMQRRQLDSYGIARGSDFR